MSALIPEVALVPFQSKQMKSAIVGVSWPMIWWHILSEHFKTCTNVICLEASQLKQNTLWASHWYGYFFRSFSSTCGMLLLLISGIGQHCVRKLLNMAWETACWLHRCQLHPPLRFWEITKVLNHIPRMFTRGMYYRVVSRQVALLVHYSEDHLLNWCARAFWILAFIYFHLLVQVFNPHLLKDLIALNLWDENMKMEIIMRKGSIKDIETIPEHIRELYKTVWELSQKVYIWLYFRTIILSVWALWTFWKTAVMFQLFLTSQFISASVIS